MKYGFIGLLLLVQVATAYGAERDMAQTSKSLFRPDATSNLICEINETGGVAGRLVPGSDKWVELGSLQSELKATGRKIKLLRLRGDAKKLAAAKKKRKNLKACNELVSDLQSGGVLGDGGCSYTVSSLPLSLRRQGKHEAKAAYINFTSIPAGTTEIALEVNAFDADDKDKGGLVINSSIDDPHPLFGSAARPEFNETDATVVLSTPRSKYALGQNRLLFIHYIRAGFIINKITARCISGGSSSSSSSSVGVNCLVSTASWQNRSFASQSGSFTFRFHATPNGNSIDGVLGLSQGVGTAFSSFGPIVRFATTGVIDVRDGGAYGSNVSFPY